MNTKKVAKRFFTIFSSFITVEKNYVEKEHKTYEHYEDKHVVIRQQN